jgi:hypothetical protein
MKVYGARGDGEAQPRPARLAITRIFYPVEGTKDFVYGINGHARSVIAHADMCLFL